MTDGLLIPILIAALAWAAKLWIDVDIRRANRRISARRSVATAAVTRRLVFEDRARAGRIESAMDGLIRSVNRFVSREVSQ